MRALSTSDPFTIGLANGREERVTTSELDGATVAGFQPGKVWLNVAHGSDDLVRMSDALYPQPLAMEEERMEALLCIDRSRRGQPVRVQQLR